MYKIIPELNFAIIHSKLETLEIEKIYTDFFNKKIDLLLSTAMMPPGVPVATVAVGKSGAKNSAILAVQILATSDDDLARKLKEYKENMRAEVLEKDKQLNS